MGIQLYLPPIRHTYHLSVVEQIESRLVCLVMHYACLNYRQYNTNKLYSDPETTFV